MCVFGTHNERVNNQRQKVNKDKMLEKWYDMGDWKLVGAAKKPCPKEQETVKQNLLAKDNFVRTGRNLGIDPEKEGSTRSEKTENKKMTFSLGSSETSRIPRTPRKVNSALDLFNSFFSNNIKLTKTSTSSPSTTLRYSSTATTSTKTSTTTSTTTTTFSSSGNSNTIMIFPDLESDLVPINSFISDSDDIEIVDYFGDGTGDCCLFNK